MAATFPSKHYIPELCGGSCGMRFCFVIYFSFPHEVMLIATKYKVAELSVVSCFPVVLLLNVD